MTEQTRDHQPPACHYDRTLGYRTTREHADDCPSHTGHLTDCPGHHGCTPCPERHCHVCSREHATPAHPVTCPECLGKIRQDLDDLAAAHAALASEATDAATDGRLAAAAPIPGSVAQILAGPTVPAPTLRTYRGWTAENFRKDHPVSKKTGQPADPIPPLAILTQWEHLYRTHLDHHTRLNPSVDRAVHYLRTQLPYIAQDTTGPDWIAFTRQLRALRAQLERVLHDEREPERGVECFECGDRLVRRFNDARRCTHSTPARDYVRHVVEVLGYPEHLTVLELRAIRQPCGACDQGGISDPRPGLSWECPGCRKHYDPGEYATAVRRDLLDNGVEGDGWTHVSMAAEAAGTLTGLVVQASLVRKWADRGKVTSCCLWTPGRPWGPRLVFWPDVADVAVAAAERHARRVARARTTTKEAS